MTPMIADNIDHLSAWKGSDFSGKDDFAIDLEPRHIEALDAALHKVRAEGLATEEITKQTFSLDAMDDLIDRMFEEIMDGRGFVMLRGWPLDQYSLEDIGAMYYGLATHFGKTASQSLLGDRLGYVMDHSDESVDERAYRHKYRLPLHTDFNELIGMLSIRKAATGGESQYASAITVHNEILATRPDLLPSLYEGFHYHRRGEEAPGQAPVTPHKVPLFSSVDGVLSCRYIVNYMQAAAKALGVELPSKFVEALAYFEEVAARDDIKLSMFVEPGEMILSNNLTTLHGRSTFENESRDPDKKRLFLRLWLDVEEERARPHIPEVAIYDQDSIAKQDGRKPTFSGAAWDDTHPQRKTQIHQAR